MESRLDATAELLLAQGDPQQALQQLTQRVRGAPADAGQRVFLFQLLAVLGQWQRAADQLRACRELDAGNAALAQTYGVLLQAEASRAKVFAGEAMPRVIGEPAPWIALLLQALQLDAQGHADQADALREQAFEQAPASSGELDGERFAWLADADPRFGPCMELVLDSGYVWVPFERIAELLFEAPSDLRDTVWASVEVTWRNGGSALGFVPVRYPGSEGAAPALQLARRTEWGGAQGQTGLGQRMWATDGAEYALLDVRHLKFDS